jgi:voltage-gated sodium channel
MNLNYWGCDRFDGGYYTSDPADAERFQYCNTTALYGSADPTPAEVSSARILNMLVAAFYFITFILVSAFVMLSLFIGAITMSMTQSMEAMKAAQEEADRKIRLEKARKRALEAERREREVTERKKRGEATGRDSPHEDPAKSEKGLSSTQKKERQKMREVLLQTWDDCDLTDILTVNQGDNNSLKGRYLMLAAMATKVVEHPRFTGFVTGVICLAGLMVGLQTSSEIEDAIGDVLSVIDSMILAVFTTEVILKLVAEGLQPWMYFKSAWNTFDFVIVVGSFTRGKGGMLTMLRLLRLLRVLKLVRAFPQLQVIVSALMKGVGSIGYIGLILMLCFYVFGIIGNVLFANNDPYHFQYLHFAMLSLFQCATMDGWSDVLYINYYGCDNYGYDGYKALGYTCKSEPKGVLAILYFCCFIVIGGMVLITLFIGVVTTSMEEATQEMEDEKDLMRRIEELRVRKNVDQAAIASYMQVFRMLDLDGSGSVEEAELRVGLAAIGKYPTYDELKEMMDVVDEDGSGQIDIVEFVEFMIHVRDKSNEQKAARDAALAVAASGDKSNGAAAAATVDGEVTRAIAATDDVVSSGMGDSKVVHIGRGGEELNDDVDGSSGGGPPISMTSSRRDLAPALRDGGVGTVTADQALTITSMTEADYTVRIDGSESPVMPMLPPSAVPSSPIASAKNAAAKSLRALSGSSRPSTPRSGRPGSGSANGNGGSSKIVPSG